MKKSRILLKRRLYIEYRMIFRIQELFVSSESRIDFRMIFRIQELFVSSESRIDFRMILVKFIKK